MGYSLENFKTVSLLLFYCVFCNQLCNDERKRFQVGYIQKRLLTVATLDGRFGVNKWLILFNPIFGLVLGVVLGAILPGVVSGVSYSIRNLSEVLMYLIPLAYWKKAEIRVN